MAKVTSYCIGAAWWSLTAFAMVSGFFFIVTGAALRKLESSLEQRLGMDPD